MKKILLLLAFIYTSNVFSQSVSKFDSIFTEWKDDHKPGVAAGVIHNGKIIYLKGFGAADIENKKKITPQTKFQVDDLAKQFTIMATLVLEQQGLLTQEDDIRKYIPSLPKYKHPIKIKHLLNQTSGLNNLDPIKELLGIRPYDVFTQQDALNIISSQQDLNFTPGTDFSYFRSDTEIILLVEIITKVSKKPFIEFTKENIFNPLGMQNTVFNNNRSLLKNTAKSYQINEQITHNPVNDLTLGATNLYTTVEDLGKWYLNYTDPTTKIGNLVKKLDQFVTTDTGKTYTSFWGKMTYGRYFDHLERGLESIWQFGIIGGYGSNVFRFHTKNFISFVIGNNNRYNGMPAMTMAYQFLKDDFPKPTSIDYTKINIKELPLNMLKQHEGFYWNKKNGLVREIYIKNDSLRYKRLESGRETALVPLNNNTFQFVVDSDDIIVMTFNKNGYSVTVGTSEASIYDKYHPTEPTSLELENYAGSYYNNELDVTYTISINKGSLEAKNLRTGTTQLFPVFKDVFRSNTYMLSGIEFIRNNEGTIIGFSINTDGLKNLKFKKMSLL